jgi:hypothetical protein
MKIRVYMTAITRVEPRKACGCHPRMVSSLESDNPLSWRNSSVGLAMHHRAQLWGPTHSKAKHGCSRVSTLSTNCPRRQSTAKSSSSNTVTPRRMCVPIHPVRRSVCRPVALPYAESYHNRCSFLVPKADVCPRRQLSLFAGLISDNVGLSEIGVCYTATMTERTEDEFWTEQIEGSGRRRRAN